MPEEVEESKAEAQEPEITVEVAEENERPGKPQLSDEEVAKLSEDSANDEVTKYAKDAQKRINSLLLANQEWRRRSVQSQKDAATATHLANQLYQDNQNLKANVQRSEGALIDQALERTQAQLQSAKARMFAAVTAQDTKAIVEANEEMARCVAEAHNLRLLKPAAPEGKDNEPRPPQQPQQEPASPAVEAWVARNPWFNQNPEMHAYALTVHHGLVAQGITEQNGTAYFGAIDKEMRQRYPEQFGMKPQEPKETPTKEQPKESGGRPVTVTGATRVNGSPAPPRTPRHVVLTESQVRIANTLGITPEQYAKELIKQEEAARGSIQ